MNARTGHPDGEEALVDRSLHDIERQLQELEALRSRHRAQIAELRERRAHVLDRLVAALLPSLDAGASARVEQLVAFGALRGPGARAAIERERHDLQGRLARLEAEPRFRDREHLGAAGIGTLPRELEELDEYRRAITASMARMAHPRLQHLLGNGYGTPEYTERFWRLSYHRDREAADEILARQPPGVSFADLRREWHKATEALATFDRRRRELRKEISALATIEAEDADVRRALASVTARHLALWRERLGRHLADLDWPALGIHLADSPAELALARQWSGLGQQIAYLDQIVTWKLMELGSVLEGERRRLLFARERRSAPPADSGLVDPTSLPPRHGDRPRASEDLAAWLQGLSATCDAVFAFDGYHRARPERDFVWSALLAEAVESAAPSTPSQGI